MKKKILIGSMLVLTLLLLIPSIPAIQQKTVEDSIYNDLVEQLDLKELNQIKQLGQLKHPFLYSIILGRVIFRLIRLYVLLSISAELEDIGGRWGYKFEVIRPNIFLRFLILLVTTNFLNKGWFYLSERLYWNWKLPIL